MAAAGMDLTDLTTRAIDVLRPATTTTTTTTTTTNLTTPSTYPKVRRLISVVGRRGHVQSAFTIKEVQELTELPDDDDDDDDDDFGERRSRDTVRASLQWR